MEKTSEQKIDMSKYWIKKYTRRINGEQKYFVAYEDFEGLAKEKESIESEIARLQGREKELMELLNDARGHLVLNPSYPSKQVVIGKIDALLSRYSGEQQKENVEG